MKVAEINLRSKSKVVCVVFCVSCLGCNDPYERK
jgi:hypothetical protein